MTPASMTRHSTLVARTHMPPALVSASLVAPQPSLGSSAAPPWLQGWAHLIAAVARSTGRCRGCNVCATTLRMRCERALLRQGDSNDKRRSADLWAGRSAACLHLNTKRLQLHACPTYSSCECVITPPPVGVETLDHSHTWRKLRSALLAPAASAA